MILEQVKKEFIIEVEALIEEKRKAIDKLTGIEKSIAQYKHLDEYEDFADFMNVRINELLIKHNLILSSQKQTDNLTIELRPIFNDFYRKYAMICAPDGGMQ